MPRRMIDLKKTRCSEEFRMNAYLIAAAIRDAYKAGQKGEQMPYEVSVLAEDDQNEDESDKALFAKMGYIGYLERMFHSAELMHRRTAEHLRKERRRRRKAEFAAENNIKAVGDFLGSETWGSIGATPEHYRGDGLVTCSRAMESCESQEKVVEPSRMAFYWWACAFKYEWRCWSKADPKTDMRKAIDCLKKAMGELSGCVRQVAHERVEWCGVTREESNG